MYKLLQLCTALCLLLASFTQVQANNLRVAVASNFYPTLTLIKTRFEQATPHSLTLIRGSTGKLYAQIVHGAPYDVFLAADVNRPLKLEQADLIVPGSRLSYAYGALALWRPDSTSQNIKQRFDDGLYQRLAIANPKIAPYGAAALQWLAQTTSIESVRPKLVYGENIAQTYQFVDSGSADLGLVALSQVINHSDYWPVDSFRHQPLEQQMVTLKSSLNQSLALEFQQFLQSDPIRQLIRNQGYQTP